MFSTKKDKQDGALLIPAASGAGGLLAYKAGHDISKLGDDIYQWVDGVHGMHDIKLGQSARAIRAVQEYSTGGSNLIKRRLLGMPLPYWTLRARDAALPWQVYGPREMSKRTLGNIRFKLAEKNNALFGWGDNAKAWEDAWNRTSNTLPVYREAQDLGKHHKLFYSSSPKDVATYIFGKNIPEYMDELSDPAKKFFQDRTMSPPMRAFRAARTSPADAQLVKKFLQQRLNMVAGKGFGGGGLSHVYADQVASRLPRLASALKGFGVGAGAAAVGLAALPLLKSASTNPEASAIELGSLAGGGLLASQGLRKIFTGPRVGTMFSEVKEHGDGHKAPGQTINRLFNELRDEGAIPRNTVIEMPTKNRYGIVDSRFHGRKYDVLADTGMGPYSWDRLKQVEGGGAAGLPLNFKRPIVGAGGYIGYQTDAGLPGDPLMGTYRSHVGNPFRSPTRYISNNLLSAIGYGDKYVTWGPEHIYTRSPGGQAVLESLSSGGLTRVHAGSGFPTASAQAMDILEGLASGKESRQAINRRLLNELLQDPSLNSGQKRKIKSVLEGGKELLAITGSGRGDYVATRARDLEKALRRRGMQDKFTILALTGDSVNEPMVKTLRDSDNIIQFARMPQKHYIGLPGTSYAHWGSTGASALAESMATPTRLSFLPDSNAYRHREVPLVQRLLRMGHRMPEDFVSMHRSVDLNTWNRGGKDWARANGAHMSQSADDFLTDILAASRNNTEEFNAARALRMFNQHKNGQAVLKDALKTKVNQISRLRKLKGAGLLGAGALAAGWGINSALDRYRENLPWWKKL